MEIEEYTYLKYYEMLSMIEENSCIAIQGKPIVIVYSSQFTKEFLNQFFALTLPLLSKIVLQKSDTYYLLCDKYKKECIEPFIITKDITGDINNNAANLIGFISELQ